VLTLTAEAPVAWVDVAAREDANLIAAQGATTVRVNGQALDQGVFLIAEEPGVPGRHSEGLSTTQWTATCPVGQPCAATVRLMAILVDPGGHPSVDVQYTATAETRFPSSGGPVPAASIDVDVSDVAAISASSTGPNTTQPEEIHLGPEVPRAIRSVHVSLPVGLPAEPVLLPNVLVLINELGQGTDDHQDILVRRVTGGEAVDVSPSAPLLGPFIDCEVAAPCEADVELQFDWTGGSAEGSSLEWSLAAWPGVGADESAEAANVDSPVATDVSWDRSALMSSLSGQARVTRSGGGFVSLGAALDLSDVPQAAGDVEGLVRLTFRAALSPGTHPAANGRLSIDGNDVLMPSPGASVTVYSLARDVTCGGRSTCSMDNAFSIGLSQDSDEVPEATVDWTADVEFLPLGAGEIPAGARIDLVVAPPPP
jgi:hypothetical protein